jgi:hypothetical protein
VKSVPNQAEVVFDMLIIKNSQLEQLSLRPYQDFIDRMLDSVTGNFTTEVKSDMLRIEVTEIIEEARHYGFEKETEIEQYLYLKWRYPVFRKYPLSKDISGILEYPDRPPGKIIDELIIYFENSGKK